MSKLNKPLFSYDDDDLEPVKKKKEEEPLEPDEYSLPNVLVDRQGNSYIQEAQDQMRRELGGYSFTTTHSPTPPPTDTVEDAEDRGEVGDYMDSKGRQVHEIHDICKTRLHVGRKNNQSFLFCPKCLTITNQ